MQLKKIADKTGPEPPRNARDEAGNLPDPARPEGALLEPWPLDHVRVLTAPARQKFSMRFVEGALLEGWLSMSGMDVGDTITLHTQPEEVSYKITAVPGRYCSHCGGKLPDDTAGQQARVHVALQHAGAASPDAENPAGYRCDNFYACERVRAKKKAG